MREVAPPPLRYLDAAAVTAAMPPLEERLALAERTMIGLVADAELPPKIAVHPRPDGSFVHAMPAHLRGGRDDGVDDLVGLKWVAGFRTNNALGLPAISAVVLVNDPATGIPVAILDGGPITAQRTAAVSGVAIGRFAPPVEGRPPRAAIVGAGTQARSHAPVVGHLLPGVELRLFDRHRERADALAREVEGLGGIGSIRVFDTARAAVEQADVVVTAASFGPDRQVMTNDWLSPEALLVPIDYATYCSADIARTAALFIVDEVGQFTAVRGAGDFEGFPDPEMSIGETLLAGTPRPDGRVVAVHLGVGLADLVFADAILRRAAERGLGTILAR